MPKPDIYSVKDKRNLYKKRKEKKSSMDKSILSFPVKVNEKPKSEKRNCQH